MNNEVWPSNTSKRVKEMNDKLSKALKRAKESLYGRNRKET
jgi:hypothetical protein